MRRLSSRNPVAHASLSEIGNIASENKLSL